MNRKERRLQARAVIGRGGFSGEKTQIVRRAFAASLKEQPVPEPIPEAPSIADLGDGLGITEMGLLVPSAPHGDLWTPRAGQKKETAQWTQAPQP